MIIMMQFFIRNYILSAAASLENAGWCWVAPTCLRSFSHFPSSGIRSPLLLAYSSLPSAHSPLLLADELLHSIVRSSLQQQLRTYQKKCNHRFHVYTSYWKILSFYNTYMFTPFFSNEDLWVIKKDLALNKWSTARFLIREQDIYHLNGNKSINKA